MSSFREVFNSNTYAIPGYPGYYYRPMDGAVVSNKTNEKYRIGKELKIYTTKEGERFVQALDYDNCRRRLFITEIEDLLVQEIQRSNQVFALRSISPEELNRVNQELNRMNQYTIQSEIPKYNYTVPNYGRGISIDHEGNVILRPAIEFYK